MSAPKIRFIVETITSERHLNGNCYHWARVTSTMTGKSLSFLSDGNAEWLVFNALNGHDGKHVTVRVVPKREWQRSTKGISLYEHNLTAADILELEKL